MRPPTIRNFFSLALAIGIACAPRPPRGETPRVEEAVRRYIHALVRAYGDLDFDPLRASATRREAERVETLVRFQAMKHLVMEAELEELRFEGVSLGAAGGSAEARTREAWRWSLKDMRSGKRAGGPRVERTELVYRLIPREGFWRVDEVRAPHPPTDTSEFPLRKEPVPGEEP